MICLFYKQKLKSYLERERLFERALFERRPDNRTKFFSASRLQMSDLVPFVDNPFTWAKRFAIGNVNSPGFFLLRLGEHNGLSEILLNWVSGLVSTCFITVGFITVGLCVGALFNIKLLILDFVPLSDIPNSRALFLIISCLLYFVNTREAQRELGQSRQVSDSQKRNR